MNKSERNKLLIGIGIGAAAGFGGGYLVCRKVSEKRHRKEISRARRLAYEDGFDRGTSTDIVNRAYEEGRRDGFLEHQEMMDECVVIPKENETSEELAARIEAKRKEIEKKLDEEEARKQEMEQAEKPQPSPADISSAPPVKIGTADYDAMNNQVVFSGAGGTRIAYPANLFIGPDGDVLDSIDIRNNIRKHEHNRARLNLIWSQMGWGAYIPDLDGSAGKVISDSLGGVEHPADITEEDINNWDLNIDGETYSDPDLLMGDEPEEKTRERERYLDEVNRYMANPEEAPRIISRQEFEDECYLDKLYFDYYDVDNKFIENTDVDNEIGPFDYFGVTDGKELFARKEHTDDDDPDIVHVKNFKMNCVIEVTRYHRSYETIRDGGAYVRDGGTD